MKYIDADKLIAEIESRIEDCKLPDGRFPTTTSIVRYEELSCLRNYITSLQPEQPELPPIGYAETYYQRGLHDGIIKGRINILRVLEDTEKRKAKPILVIKEQDQPAVDLEKAARHVYESRMGCTMDDVLRDMVELSRVLNARKEE